MLHKGLTLDSQRNYLDFSKNNLNQNQELFDSRYVAEEEEDHHGFRIESHGFLLHGGVGGAVVAQPLLPPQKKRLSPAGGEIVEVHGGHIVRSTCQKDRHSKIWTAKGPRDRRVRLAAHTAIQFYDVQDRLGYDRPSKAVDWLIKKAKIAIDELSSTTNNNTTNTTTTTTNTTTTTTTTNTTTTTSSTSILNFESNPDDVMVDYQMRIPQNSNFLPQSLDSRNGNQSQDLRLSLQSLKDPIFHNQETQEGSNSMFLDGSSWPERMVGWGGDGGFALSSQPTQTTLLNQTTNSHLFHDNSQRGPLQSSNTPSIRAWVDQPPFVGAAVDHHPSSISGFTSGVGEFSE